MHEIQAKILRALLFKQELRFSEINADNVSNDHFTFHVKKLVEIGLVEKRENSLYQLTIIGKEYANRLDADNKEKIVVERQAKIGAMVVCVKGTGEDRKYLVQQRLKQPYYGFYGFITGKVKWGETVYEASARELDEETGLKAKLDLAGIEHKIDYSKEGQLLEDKFFYIFRGEETSGALVENFEGGRNIWLTRKEIEGLPDVFDDVFELLEIIDKGKFVFIENRYNVKRY